MTTTIDLGDLLHCHEAAEILGVKTTTLERWRCMGKGPQFIKFGDFKGAPVRYLRSELAAWLSNQRFRSTSGYGARSSTPASTMQKPWG